MQAQQKAGAVGCKQFDTLSMYKISIFIFLFLFGCRDTVKYEKVSSTQDTTAQPLQTNSTSLKRKNLGTDERRKGDEDQDIIDSIRLLKVLDSALTYANRNKLRNSFHHRFEMAPDDSSFNIVTQMTYGHLFSSDKKHLIVKRTLPEGPVFDVFLLENNDFKNVCERDQTGLTYIDDTLKDINGDGYKDFLVHWYPSSGCCRREVYAVYLYQPIGSFTKEYEFMNPTFFPKDKLIRGVKYGHSGEVGLYKYRWKALEVDTIEFIYPYINHKGKFIRTRVPEYRPTEKNGIVLKALPPEYNHIESIDYFLDY